MQLVSVMQGEAEVELSYHFQAVNNPEAASKSAK